MMYKCVIMQVPHFEVGGRRPDKINDISDELHSYSHMTSGGGERATW